MVSQEWPTTVARWKIVAQSKGTSSQVVAHTSKPPDTPRVLAMKIIAQNCTLVSGYSLTEQVQTLSLMVHAVQDVQIAAQTVIGLSYPVKTSTFSPNRVVEKVISKTFENLQPQHNQNRSRLSGAAKTFTFRAQKIRGSEKGCVIKRTYDPKYGKLIHLVHSLSYG